MSWHPAESEIDAARDVIVSAATRSKINGVVSIESDEITIFKGAFGFSNLEGQIPNTMDTQFLLGSNTKLFTAVAVMQLVERGRLALAEPIGQFFPDHRDAIDPAATVHHLLSHTAGVIDFWDLDCFDGDIQMIEVVEYRLVSALFRHSTWAVGKYSYSNAGYYLLGVVIERLAGQSYAEYVRQHIFDPLRMKDSGVHDQDAIVPGMASGYRLKEGYLEPAPYYEMRKLRACGGMYSTTADVTRWLKSLCSGRVVSAESFAAIGTPVVGNRGYGCRVETTGGTQWICHDGYVSGHYSHVRLYPSIGLRMQVLRNSSAFAREVPDEFDPDDFCNEVAHILGIGKQGKAR